MEPEEEANMRERSKTAPRLFQKPILGDPVAILSYPRRCPFLPLDFLVLTNPRRCSGALLGFTGPDSVADSTLSNIRLPCRLSGARAQRNL